MFASELSSRGFSASDSDVPDSPRLVWEALTEIGQWWERLDSQTKSVLRNVGPDLAPAIGDAGFGGPWPHLISMIGRGPANAPVPDGVNAVIYAWGRVREESQGEEHYNDEDFADWEAIRDLAVDDLSQY